MIDSRNSRTGHVIPCLTLYGEDGTVFDACIVVGLSVNPPGFGGRQGAARGVVADERALGDDVGDADPDVNLRGGDVQCALVLGLGAWHGQVGAERSTRRRSLAVVGRLIQELQAAAGTAAEAGRTAARLRLSA